MNVPSLNLDTQAVSADTLSQYLMEMQDQIRIRTRAMFAGLNPGIISKTNPNTLSSGANPLQVLAGATNFVVHVLAGSAVTASGDFLELKQDTDVQLAVISEAGVNVVFLYQQLVTNTVRVLASTGQMVPTGAHLETQITAMSLADYLATPADLRDQGVALALVTYYSTGSKITYADSSKSWLRPWFSSVDIEHRNHLGSGVVTDTNPHGLAVNDLTDSSGHGVYSQLTKSGMIFSRDSSVSGIPGYMCSTIYTSSEFQVDATGEITRGSVFGGAGCWYLQLDAYATQILRVQDLDSITGTVGAENNYQYIVDLIPGTRVLVFVTDRAPTVGCVVHYMHTPTLEITSEASASLAFAGVDKQELVITEDIGLSDVQSTVVFIRRYNAIPMTVHVVARGSGQLVLDPHVVASNQRPATLGATVTTVAETFTCPMYIGIGATRLGVSSNTRLSIQLVGLDVDGNSLTETITLQLGQNATWEDTVDVIANQEPLRQTLWTKNSFQDLISYQVVASDDIDTSGYFQIYARIDPARAHTARVASAFWNKRELVDIRDSRRILPTVRDGIYGQTSISALGELLTCTNQVLLSQSSTQLIVQLIACEDFQQPRYLDAPSVIWAGREILDTPSIPASITDSRRYVNCYRSRILGMNKPSAAQVLVIVVLHNADAARCSYGSVRARVENFNNAWEIPLRRVVEDTTNRTYMGLLQSTSAYPYHGIGFVISGKCQGYSAYFVIPNSSDSTQNISDIYKLTPIAVSSQRKS